MSAVNIPNADRLVVRWTVGDVRERGFEMLRLSMALARRLFGPAARYLVCANTVAVHEAQQRVGPLPFEAEWRASLRGDVPAVLSRHFGEHFVDGMGWKLIPLRTYPEQYELAIDNDVMLWALPEGMRRWLESSDGALMAEDAERYLGSFDAQCPPGAWNAGIRGLAPGKDLSAELEAVLQEAERHAGGKLDLSQEIEEQGLQAAALLSLNPYVVRRDEVTICSPFWPRSPELGSCGAHFVGMNARHIPWDYYDRPADDWLAEHWQRHRPELYERAGLHLPTADD